MRLINKMPKIIKKMFKSSAMLTIFVVTGVVLLLITKFITSPAIEQAKITKIKAAFNQVIAADKYDNLPFEDKIIIIDERAFNTTHPITIYRARKNNQPVALIIKTIAPDGYSGDIKILIAIKKDNTISGVRVLQHRETPGLGDKIEVRKDDWIKKFAGLSLTDDNMNQWRVKKDGGKFDQFTGATITPRAVVRAIKNTLIFVQQNQQKLWAPLKP